MKAKLLAALALAIFAIPAPATQQSVVESRLAAMQQVLGVDVDPHTSRHLSLTLPKGFERFDAAADPFAR